MKVPQTRGRKPTVLFKNKTEVNRKYQAGFSNNEKVPVNVVKISPSLPMGSRFQALQEMSNVVDLCSQVETNGTIAKEVGATSFTISHASKTIRKSLQEISNRKSIETPKKTNQTTQLTQGTSLTKARNKKICLSKETKKINPQVWQLSFNGLL